MYTHRTVIEEDFDFLYSLHRTTMRAYIEPIWGWHEDWQEEYFRKKFSAQGRRIIVIDGRDAGVLVVERRTDEIYLALIEILPGYQGLGVGSAIINQLKEDARREGMPISLHVLQTNHPARRLYERLGFRVTDEEEARYRMIWEDN